jgi:hypothetical protein
MIKENPKTGRFTVFQQNPEKIGKFGEWKITGSYKTKPEAEANV